VKSNPTPSKPSKPPADVIGPSFWEHKTTPWTAMLSTRYSMAGYDRWNNLRVVKTCRLLGVDIFTLCAWVGVFDRRRVLTIAKKDVWPVEIALQFDRLERLKAGIKAPSFQDIFAAQLIAASDKEKKEPIND